MEAICLLFDDFYLIVYSFQLSGINRIVAVIQDSSLVIQNHFQVAVASADGDFVYSQDTKALMIGLPIGFFHELPVDRLDCFPVQPQGGKQPP